MSFQFKDRVWETTSSGGSGAFQLSGNLVSYQTFLGAGYANGDVFKYTAFVGTQWEIGTGTYVSATNTITRTSIDAFSTGDTNPVTFAAAPQVICDFSALCAQSLIGTTSGLVLTSVANGLPVFRNLTATNAVTLLGQSNLPMIMLGKGSFGNNGAFTATTAFPATYASGYAYITAGGVAAGVPAADAILYFTASSGTALTFFNNAYSSGTPAIPGSPTAFVTTGAGAYTGASTSKTMYSLSIPGNTLGLNGGLRVFVLVSMTGTTATKTFSLTYGGTTFNNFAEATSTVLASSNIFGLKNRGATNAQISLTPVSGPIGTGTLFPDTGSVDTTQAQNLILQITNATPATNNAVLEQITVELLPSVA